MQLKCKPCKSASQKPLERLPIHCIEWFNRCNLGEKNFSMKFIEVCGSGWEDLNLRPTRPERGVLPGSAPPKNTDKNL